MAKTREQKRDDIAKLADILSNAKIVIFTDYRGLKMSEMEELRNLSFEKNTDYKVAKINLLRLAAQNSKIQINTDTFKDRPLALSIGYKDEITPAKIIYDFSKDHKNLEILGGIINNKLIDIDTIKAYALLPSEDELYARLVGSIAAPISRMVNVLSGTARSMVNILLARQKSIS